MQQCGVIRRGPNPEDTLNTDGDGKVSLQEISDGVRDTATLRGEFAGVLMEADEVGNYMLTVDEAIGIVDDSASRDAERSAMEGIQRSSQTLRSSACFHPDD